MPASNIFPKVLAHPARLRSRFPGALDGQVFVTVANNRSCPIEVYVSDVNSNDPSVATVERSCPAASMIVMGRDNLRSSRRTNVSPQVEVARWQPQDQGNAGIEVVLMIRSDLGNHLGYVSAWTQVSVVDDG